MNLYEINFTETAIYNLDEISSYISIELEDILVAEKIVKNIVKKCYRLAFFPEAQAVRFTVADRKMRLVRSGKYIIIYSVNKNARIVDIEYITHARRDFNNLKS